MEPGGAMPLITKKVKNAVITLTPWLMKPEGSMPLITKKG